MRAVFFLLGFLVSACGGFVDPPNLTCEWQETDRFVAPEGQCVRLTALDERSGVSFGEESCSEVQACVVIGPGDVATFYAKASRFGMSASVKVERWDCSYPAPCE